MMNESLENKHVLIKQKREAESCIFATNCKQNVQLGLTGSKI